MEKLNERTFQYLIHLFDTNTTQDLHELLTHSEIHYKISHLFNNANGIDLTISVHPEIYKKYQAALPVFREKIKDSLSRIVGGKVTACMFVPDLSKFQLLRNNYTPAFTPWEEINNLQNRLIQQLRSSNETIDFQNIGNTARTILQKVSTIVFDPSKHVADTPDKKIDLSEGKFKNRLHTYIKVELGGESNKELRDFAISIIDAAEKSVDISNKLTHDLNAKQLLAEASVISTITAVGMIKLIDEHKISPTPHN